MIKNTNNKFIEKARKIHGEKYSYDLIDYKNNISKVIIICPIHGKFLQKPYIHLSGSGCPKCSIRNRGNKQMKTSYEKLLKILKSKNGKLLSNEYMGILKKYIFQCEFGHTWTTSASAIINNKNWCPKCKGVLIGNKLRRKNGIEYLNNLAKRNNGFCISDVYVTVNYKYEWKCQNGHTWFASAKHVKNGTWCPICNKESKGEKEISRILNELNVNYIREYSFNDCRGKKQPLSFDFYLPKYNCCIEYDGEQHFIFRETGIFENKLEEIKKSEIIKIKYCNEKNIKLIRIPYGFKKKLKKILTIEYENEFKNSVDYTKCILITVGTRPEELKTFKLLEILEQNSIPVLYLFTGQHKNLINRHKYDFLYNIRNNKELNRLDSIISKITENLGRFFHKHPYITHVLVQGDTTSALAIALSAFNNGIKVIHLEAGLRTYDKENPYPEEMNRRLISQIADIHFCPTKQSQKNLIEEKIYTESYVVGNTVIDNLLPYKDKCEYTNKILITLHRRENHPIINKWFTELNKLAEMFPEYEFILPIHPNPNVQKYKYLLKNVNVIDPLPYEEMLDLLVKTRLIITDSGGLQEESCFFNKKCLTCRIVTERPEALGLSTFMVRSPDKLIEVFKEHHDNYKINVECPFGDGHAAEKIMLILKNMM